LEHKSRNILPNNIQSHGGQTLNKEKNQFVEAGDLTLLFETIFDARA